MKIAGIDCESIPARQQHLAKDVTMNTTYADNVKRPPYSWWVDRQVYFGMRIGGDGLIGPCPSCHQGDDRFGVRKTDGLFSNRKDCCTPKQIFQAIRNAGWQSGKKQDSGKELEGAARVIHANNSEAKAIEKTIKKGVVPTNAGHSKAGKSAQGFLDVSDNSRQGKSA